MLSGRGYSLQAGTGMVLRFLEELIRIGQG